MKSIVLRILSVILLIIILANNNTIYMDTTYFKFGHDIFGDISHVRLIEPLSHHS